MISLNSQSARSGAIANALSATARTPGHAIARASSGALSTASTSAPSDPRTQLHPPGAAPRSMHRSPARGQTPNRVSASHNFR